jgi:DNA repair exonuclease SbcCD ATPase subunit
MGTTTVTRHASGNLTAQQLPGWFREQLDEMAREGGTHSYCGNWNCNSGLRIVAGKFTEKEAADYAEKNIERRGAVLAFQIGDFSKVWPVTKAQKDISERLAKLETEANEFDYRILERAQQQKSKTKKCAHCESSINVHKLEKPQLSELTKSCASNYDSGIMYRFGRYMISSFFGMTDCPVCCKNLLKTDTDKKNQESLTKRLDEARTRARKSREEFATEQVGKPAPFWYVIGECAC